MKSKLQKQEKGFTIIEVLIVLAIAGLIVLVVFLAVPALQRNSRNTQRKNDVSSLAGTYQEIINNANGTRPADCTGNDANCWVRNSKMSYYENQTGTNVSWNNQSAIADTAELNPATETDRDKVNIANGIKCNANNDGTTVTTNATVRSVAIQYMVETSGEPVLQCQEL